MVGCHGCESTLVEGGEEASELPFISLFGTSLPLLMSPPPTQLLFTQQNDFQRTHVYLLQPGSGSEIYCLWCSISLQLKTPGDPIQPNPRCYIYLKWPFWKQTLSYKKFSHFMKNGIDYFTQVSLQTEEQHKCFLFVRRIF